jgi:hypothetical protein
VAKKNKPKASANKNQPAKKSPTQPLNAPWISMRTGIIVIAIVSAVMAVLTGYQAQQSGRTLLDSILLGLLFGGLIWAIFFGNLLVNRFLRRKK